MAVRPGALQCQQNQTSRSWSGHPVCSPRTMEPSVRRRGWFRRFGCRPARMFPGAVVVTRNCSSLTASSSRATRGSPSSECSPRDRVDAGDRQVERAERGALDCTGRVRRPRAYLWWLPGLASASGSSPRPETVATRVFAPQPARNSSPTPIVSPPCAACHRHLNSSTGCRIPHIPRTLPSGGAGRRSPRRITVNADSDCDCWFGTSAPLVLGRRLLEAGWRGDCGCALQPSPAYRFDAT